MSAELPYRPARELQQVLDDLERVGNPLDSMTRQTAPQLWLQREIWAKNILARIPVKIVRDMCIPARNHQVPIRIYWPEDKPLMRQGKLPLLLYLHGGGWTLGSIACYDSVTRFLANHIPAIVVSADYRLAPEHPFPAAIDDAQLVLEWLWRNAEEIGADRMRFAVAGDSAGGALATVISLRGRKEGIPIAFQALFYPSTNISRTDYPSYQQYGQRHWLTTKALESFREFYLPDPADWFSPDASPLLASDEDLRLMPPALVVTCGCDVLRDEGQAYAKRLKENGVEVVERLHEPMIHACLNLFNLRQYPAASKVVTPVLEEAARVIGERMTR